MAKIFMIGVLVLLTAPISIPVILFLTVIIVLGYITTGLFTIISEMWND